MNVFISWSGELSRAVAELMSTWIKSVIQRTTPWISNRDIDKGALWFGELQEKLKDTSIGIICITKENRDRPWILFEAGALAKGLSSSRVCTFLIDLQPLDLREPLAQFNHTLPTKESMLQLVRTLNSSLGEHALEKEFLGQTFLTYWSQFEAGFQQALESFASAATLTPPPPEVMLAEILESIRIIKLRMEKSEAYRKRVDGVFAELAALRRQSPETPLSGRLLEDLVAVAKEEGEMR